MNLILFIIIGLVAGWIASKLMLGRGLGLAGDLVVGVLGAMLGGVFGFLLGFEYLGIIGTFIFALAGSSVLLYFVYLFTDRTI